MASERAPAPIFVPTSRGRIARQRVFVGLAIAALILALVPLVAVFGYIFANGIGSFTSLDFLVKDPPPDLTATGGGVRNALVGTIEMTGIASLIAFRSDWPSRFSPSKSVVASPGGHAS